MFSSTALGITRNWLQFQNGFSVARIIWFRWSSVLFIASCAIACQQWFCFRNFHSDFIFQYLQGFKTRMLFFLQNLQPYRIRQLELNCNSIFTEHFSFWFTPDVLLMKIQSWSVLFFLWKFKNNSKKLTQDHYNKNRTSIQEKWEQRERSVKEINGNKNLLLITASYRQFILETSRLNWSCSMLLHISKIMFTMPLKEAGSGWWYESCPSNYLIKVLFKCDQDCMQANPESQ